MLNNRRLFSFSIPLTRSFGCICIAALLPIAGNTAQAAISVVPVAPGATATLNSVLTIGDLTTTSYAVGGSSGAVIQFGFRMDVMTFQYDPTQPALIGMTDAVKAGLDASSSHVALLGAGDVVGSSTDWSSHLRFSNNGVGPWAGGAEGYMALRLSAGGTDYNYGYLKLAYDAALATITLQEFVWETEVNKAITVSAVPEPTTYAALLAVAGASVVIARRRRRS